MLKETEKQGKNIETINEALRLRTHRTLCISAIFLLVLVSVIAAIVGGLIVKSVHISEVSSKLEASLRENTLRGIELTTRLSGIDERMDENEANLIDLKTDLTNDLNTVISKLNSVSSTLDRVYGRVYSYGSSSIYTKVGSIATAQNSHVVKLNTVSSNVDTIKDTTNAMKTTQLTHVNKLNSVSGTLDQVYGRVYSYGSNSIYNKVDNIKDTTDAMKTTQVAHVNKLNSVSNVVDSIFQQC